MALGDPYLQKTITAVSEILRSEREVAAKTQAIRNHLSEVESDKRYFIDAEFPQHLYWFNISDQMGLKFSDHLRGKIVILDFFTYCCINCMHILPDLHDLEEKFCDSGVVVIGVHSSKFPNEKGSENILNAILRYNITHPVVNDANIELRDRLNVSCWPTLVLIGPDQKLLYYIIGEGHTQELSLVVETCVSFYKEKNQLNIDTIGIALEKHKSAIWGLYFPGKIMYNPLKKQLYISDSSNHRILVVDRDTGLVVHTFGSGKPGLKDGVEEEAEFNTPQGMSYYEECLYVADTENHSIRKVN